MSARRSFRSRRRHVARSDAVARVFGWRIGRIRHIEGRIDVRLGDLGRVEVGRDVRGGVFEVGRRAVGERVHSRLGGRADRRVFGGAGDEAEDDGEGHAAYHVVTRRRARGRARSRGRCSCRRPRGRARPRGRRSGSAPRRGLGFRGRRGSRGCRRRCARSRRNQRRLPAPSASKLARSRSPSPSSSTSPATTLPRPHSPSHRPQSLELDSATTSSKRTEASCSTPS